MPSLLLLQTLDKVIENNPDVVKDLTTGKLVAIGKLIGLVRKEMPSANPIETKEAIEAKFNVKMPEKEKSSEVVKDNWKRFKDRRDGRIYVLRFTSLGVVYFSPEDLSTTYATFGQDFEKNYEAIK
jgi:hypothetical protein